MGWNAGADDASSVGDIEDLRMSEGSSDGRLQKQAVEHHPVHPATPSYGATTDEEHSERAAQVAEGGDLAVGEKAREFLALYPEAFTSAFVSYPSARWS